MKNGKPVVAVKVADLDMDTYRVRDLDHGWVKRLAEVYEIGGRLEPLPEVTKVNERYAVIKGHHRVCPSPSKWRGRMLGPGTVGMPPCGRPSRSW